MGSRSHCVRSWGLVAAVGIALLGATPGCGSNDDTGGDGGSDAGPPAEPALCPDSLPPGWIFCDDFEQGLDAGRYAGTWGGGTFY